MVLNIDAFYRLAFCHHPLPDPPAGDVAPSQFFSVVYFFFAVLGLINVFFDATEAIQRLMLGYRFVGGSLLIGMFLARSVATLGYIMIHKHGGFRCVFFFQDSRDFMARFDKSQQRAIRSLFVLFFTELAVFGFEDVILQVAWYSYGIYGTDEILFRLNYWTTLIAAIARGLLLTGLLILSMVFWTWKKNCCEIFVQLLAALAFLGLMFLSFLVTMASTFWDNDISREPNEQSDSSAITDAGYILSVVASWTASSFLFCYLLAKSRNFDPFHEPQMTVVNQGQLEIVAAADVVEEEENEGPADIPLVAALPFEARTADTKEIEIPTTIVDPESIILHTSK